MNALAIGVTPAHNDVFVNVVAGVKKENVKMLVDGLAKYMERRADDVEDLDAPSSVAGDNPIAASIAQFDAVIARYVQQGHCFARCMQRV
jgi:hypothetical protein